VHDAIEFFDARGALARSFRLSVLCVLCAQCGEVRRRSECDLGQLGSVDAAVGIEDLTAEVADDFVVDGFPRLHQRVRDAVRLHQAGAQGDDHVSHHRLSGSDAAGEADFQHGSP
jgi:hypothetical protein